MSRRIQTKELRIAKTQNNIDKRLICIFLSAIMFRLAMYLLYFVIMAMFGEYTNGISFKDYLDGWNRWDSKHYLNLAELTYQGYIEDGEPLFLVYLPLYPWLMRLLNYLTHSYAIAGLLISSVGYAIGLVYFDLVVRRHYDEEISNLAIIGLSVFPFSFFAGGIMTEGLFLALSAAFLYYLETKRYVLTTVLGFFACLTKLQGGFLAFVVLAYLLQENNWITLIKNRDFKGFLKKIVIPGVRYIPMLLGIVVYLWLNYRVAGDPFKFMFYQKTHWGHTVGPIWNTFKYCLENYIGNKFAPIGYVLWLPQIIMMLVGVLAIVYALRVNMRPHFLTYLIVFYLVTFSSTWLVSGGRYCISIWPLFLVEGIVLKRHPRLKMPVLGISLSLMMLFTVAYFKWMPIM